MEENKQPSEGTPSNPETGDSTAGSKRQSQSTQELMDELNRLGLKFAETVQAAWESDERKRLEKDVKAGVVSLVEGLERGLRRVSETDQAKEFLNKAEDAAETVGERIRSSQTGRELATGLSKGLRILAEQIDKLAEEWQHKAASAPPSSTPKPPTPPADDDSQNIPITKV